MNIQTLKFETPRAELYCEKCGTTNYTPLGLEISQTSKNSNTAKTLNVFR
jgi:hypothetical protein